MAPVALPAATYPQPSAVAELLKPITWFPPMWAFGCGVVASGQALEGRWGLVLAGILLAGPFVCATSQAVNDWFDRHVDAINEPQRPIPSGRMPGRWGLYVALIWTGLSLLLSLALGPWGFGAAVVGLGLAWAYSAPPLRLKRNGWWGNLACGVSYEGLAWVTGAAVMAGGGMPALPSLLLAGLYSLGAHGIMTLTDFKSIEGDRRMGKRVGMVKIAGGQDDPPGGIGTPRGAEGKGAGAALEVGNLGIGVDLQVFHLGYPAVIGQRFAAGGCGQGRRKGVAANLEVAGFGKENHLAGPAVQGVEQGAFFEYHGAQAGAGSLEGCRQTHRSGTNHYQIPDHRFRL